MADLIPAVFLRQRQRNFNTLNLIIPALGRSHPDRNQVERETSASLPMWVHLNTYFKLKIEEGEQGIEVFGRETMAQMIHMVRSEMNDVGRVLKIPQADMTEYHDQLLQYYAGHLNRIRRGLHGLYERYKDDL